MGVEFKRREDGVMEVYVDGEYAGVIVETSSSEEFEQKLRAENEDWHRTTSVSKGGKFKQ